MKRHSTDGVSLFFGLIFVGIAAWWAVESVVDIDIPNFSWMVAIGLIVVGLLGVALSLRNGGRHGRPAEPGESALVDSMGREASVDAEVDDDPTR